MRWRATDRIPAAQVSLETDRVREFQRACSRRIGRRPLAQTSSEELGRVLSFAPSCAAFTCGRAGADPPWQADMRAALSRLVKT